MYKLDFAKVFQVLRLKLIERLKVTCPVHDADLRKSIDLQNTIIEGDEEIGVELKFYMARYWAPVEFGSVPHWTSVENLKKWAKDKWGDEDLAYALQRHIAKHGTKPNPFIRKILDEEFDDLLIESIRQLGQDALIKV